MKSSPNSTSTKPMTAPTATESELQQFAQLLEKFFGNITL